MHAHMVLAHPEPKSFNAHLVETGVKALRSAGWTTTVSDLSAMGFDPCERAEHYHDRANPDRFDVQAEQRYASNAGTLPDQVMEELERLDHADLVILQYPMWWHLPPAIMKGWFDRVWAYGAAYTSAKRFEDGRFVGKRAMLSVTVGTSRESYGHDGRSGDIDLMLWPVNFNLAYAGFTVLQPFVAYGVEAGLRYSDAAQVAERLAAVTEDFRSIMEDGAGERAAIAFNRKADWGADGRIRPTAPAFSPFIRHRKNLDLT